MSPIDTNSNTEIAYKLSKYISNDSLEYIYRGNVNSAIAENILSLAENNISKSRDKILIRKRVYFIMVECLQNITRHQETITNGNFDQKGLFILKKKKYSYYITSANLIKNSTIESLKSKIEKINTLNSESLKQYSRQVLDNGTFSSKGGAGLGLIEMARKSGRKFRYEFNQINDTYSIFYLHLSIPINKIAENEKETKEEIKEYEEYTIEKIKQLHNFTSSNDILLNFNGILNQENLKNLMNILSKQITTSQTLKTRLYNIMVEILQNIVLHAINITTNEEKGNYGMFIIREKENKLLVTAANYIPKDKVENLKTLIEKINNSDKDTRNQIIHNTQEQGQGLATLINKSKNKLKYNFSEINQEIYLYSITVTLEK
ncbi:MAG: SiaB family protein kinase [Bacteroidales bacterium]|nr:SiaB family protein kinase [Bacteroidales bacterium]